MADGKRVIVTGATGLIGKELCRRLQAKDYQVVVFSRNPEAAHRVVPGAAEYVAWQPEQSGPWTSAVDGSYAVIHLASANLFSKRWTEGYKREIMNSRVEGTHGLVSAMKQAAQKPQVFISGSAIGYYGFRGDEPVDESGAPGNDFLAQVVKAWEYEAMQAEKMGIRTVILRSGVVLDPSGGALKQLMLPFSLFVGGPILPGSQWFSWVHIADEVGIILLALENEQVRGPLNATAPNPQTNRDFAVSLGKVMGRPSWIPVPGFALNILVGEVADTVTKGQRVISKKAQELGYQFQFPTSEAALRDLLKNSRQP